MPAGRNKSSERVADDEHLRRRVKPEWIDPETGRPSAAAFSKEDLMFPQRGGLSVNRSAENEAHRAERLPDGWPASVDANAGDVRKVRSGDGSPLFRVDATPTPDNVDHASIFYLAALCPDARITPSQARRARRLLLTRFKQPGYGQNGLQNLTEVPPNAERCGSA